MSIHCPSDHLTRSGRRDCTPLFTALALLVGLFTTVAAQLPEPSLARPTPEQAAWQDLELGMFIHYDIPVFKPGWDHRQYDKRPEPGLFNPRKLNTDQWMEAAKAMGAKYAVFVAKHGSGFMCWQSDLYPYGMKQSPFQNGQGDIVRDFVNSSRKYGIQPGIYAHMGCNGYFEVDNPGLVNRGKGGDPDKQARYARTCEGMLRELWGNYGALSEIWFDGGVMDPDKGGPDMLPILRQFQPHAIVFQGPAASIRWIGNEDGVAPDPCWATVPTTRDYSGPGTPDGPRWLPGECDVPIRQGVWLWEPNTESRLFTVGQLVDRYCRSVGHNCNLLLNANPDPDGLIPEPDVQRYREFGAEIRRRFGRSLAQTSGQGALVELSLPKPAWIDRAMTMENILEGERVRQYVIDSPLSVSIRTAPNGGWSQTRFASLPAPKPRAVMYPSSPLRAIALFLCKGESPPLKSSPSRPASPRARAPRLSSPPSTAIITRLWCSNSSSAWKVNRSSAWLKSLCSRNRTT
jgi:alpha-L-fucosidase